MVQPHYITQKKIQWSCEITYINTTGSNICEYKYGCAEQYMCVAGLYFLSIWPHAFKIVIYQYLGAPGHGTSIVDGLNSVDKKFPVINIMNLYVTSKTTNKPYIELCYSKTNGLTSLDEELILQLSNSQRNLILDNAITYKSRISVQKCKNTFYH